MIDLTLSHEGEPRLSLPFLSLLLGLVPVDQITMNRALHLADMDNFRRHISLRELYKERTRSLTLSLSHPLRLIQTLWPAGPSYSCLNPLQRRPQ